LLAMVPVVAIVGPRQCGKSTLARQLRPEWNYYDLESPEDYQFVSNDPSTFLQLNQENIIIDEAQQYPELFKVLRGVIDSERSRKGRFIITGSSSPEIVKGLTESLAGRIAIVELSPFKVCEFKERPLPNFYELITQNGQWDLSKLEPSSTLKESLEMWHSGGY